MAGCTTYQFYYGTGGVLSASYLLCGDNTPCNVSLTGGVSGNPVNTSNGIAGSSSPGIVVAVTGSVTTYTGYASAGATVPGFVYIPVVRPWGLYTLGTAVSALSAHSLP